MSGRFFETFPPPVLGYFDRKKYIGDFFNFMRNSKDVFDSKTKSVSYEDETVSFQPCLYQEDFESLFTNNLMEILCEKRTSLEENSSLTFLIFTNRSIPIGYLTIHAEEDRIIIGELKVVKASDNYKTLSGILIVLMSWMAEALNVFLLEATFQDSLETLVDESLAFRNIKPLIKSGFPRLLFVASPLEPKDVNLVLTAGPSITPLERNYSAKAAAFGWNAHHSDFLIEFERQFANYVGVEFAIATSSCTGALHLSLLALGIGPGDEVIVPNITWVATASVVSYVGATPVFADVDSKTWTIDLASLSRLVNSKTKAIIPVHLYGFAADMAAIMEFAHQHNLFVIEDAAPAIGTLINQRAAGTFGDIGCYSFQGAKMLVTGEGGMIVTDSKDIFDRLKKLQDHGRVPGTFWIDQVGHKYKLSNIAASIGLAQLMSVERQITRKREINHEYRQLLSQDARIEFQSETPNSRSICWMTSITLKETDRNDLFRFLASRGIDTRPTFPRISSYPIWATPVKHEFAKADFIAENGVNLPSGVNLTSQKISHVAKTILEFLSKK